MQSYSSKLKELRLLLKKKRLNGFVVPSNDEFQSEFCPPHARRLEWLTGFTGSTGVAVVLENKAAFFTDGRYTLQAKQQLGKEYSLFNIADKKPWQWASENMKNGKLAIDSWLHCESNAQQYLDATNIVTCKTNLIDLLWKDKPAFPNDPIKAHPLKYAGKKSSDKISAITAKLKEHNADALIITAPDSVCWLLNIRGNDIPTTPFVLANAILYKTGKIKLYIDKKRITEQLSSHLGADVKIAPENTLIKDLKLLKNKTIMLNPSSAPYAIIKSLGKKNVIRAADPCQLPKACKNSAEIKGTIDAHITDGAAIAKFLHWLYTSQSTTRITEVSAARKLYHFRKEAKDFRDISFDTIAGFAGNGAIVHYRPSEESDKEIKGNDLFLLDSGGQYLGGTTDITRTIAIGKPTKEQKANYTRVLKGHIAIASAVFPVGTTGTQLDILARQFLWQNGLDYDHGTGHGVGSYLSVHEGPQRISKVSSKVALKPGMIISNEPGYYKADQYGIRIENLVLVVERNDLKNDNRQFLGFETITKAPIDQSLIEQNMMTNQELDWLNNYHKQVVKELSPLLDKQVKEWLKEMTNV